jgi:hypothetical protein
MVVCAESLSDELDSFRTRHEMMEYLVEHLKHERIRSDQNMARLRYTPISSYLTSRTVFSSFATTESLAKALFESIHLGSMVPHADFSGYLTKKSRGGDGWQTRYFILRDHFLMYYKSENDTRALPRECIRIDDALIADTENPTTADLKDMTILKLTLLDHHRDDKRANREFYLAGGMQEMVRWRHVLRCASGWWTRKSSVKSVQDDMRRRLSVASTIQHVSVTR